MNPTESLLVLGIAALATAIAVGALSVPTELLSSSVSQAFMLVIALILFSYSPVVGISALALFAVIMFHRNVRKTIQYSAELSGMKEYITAKDNGNVSAYDTMDRQQRDIQKFQDAYEPYQSQNKHMESVQQLNMNQSEGYETQENGMYPNHSTTQMEDVRTDTFMYRPGPDMGDNTFEPVGSSIDEKYAAFKY